MHNEEKLKNTTDLVAPYIR